MKIRKIKIKNYRSIGEEGLELSFAKHDKLFLIGENNVGKSNILKAINRVFNLDVAFSPEEWHNSNQNKSIEVAMEIELTDMELQELLEHIDASELLMEFKESFGNRLVYEFKKALGGSSKLIRFGELRVFGREASIFRDDLAGVIHYIDWEEFLKEYKEEKTKKSSLKKEIKDHVALLAVAQGAPGVLRSWYISFKNNWLELILKWLSKRIIILPEFRKVPERNMSNVLISPEASHLSSVLFNLKNGRKQLKDKFKKIQKVFSALYPQLSLDVIKEQNNIEIVVERSGVESTTDFIGAGILETINILTHVIANENAFICIDEPELHLHPHSIKVLAKVIKESPNQFLIVTHSPTIASVSEINGLIRVLEYNGNTSLLSCQRGYLKKEELRKLKHHLNVERAELFFAKKVLLVEGLTEVGAFPVFGSSVEYDFAENGVSVIDLGGKNSAPLFMKLLNCFQIPYVLVLDKDVGENKKFMYEIKKIAEEGEGVIKILSKNFEEIVNEKAPDILRKAKKEAGGGKPLIGTYVAHQLVKKRAVPKEFIEIINLLKEIDRGRGHK